MAINLNPGADASLVAQSYRMGMAGVPKDLSKTFEGMATSYSAALEKVGAAAKEVANVVGQVAGEAAKTAIDIQRNYTEGKLSPLDEVTSIKDQLKEARNEPLGSTERKKAVAEAKKRRDKFFGDVKTLREDRISQLQVLADESYDSKASGKYNIAKATAITLQGDPIKDGPYKGLVATAGRNLSGDVEWTFSGFPTEDKDNFSNTIKQRDVRGLLLPDADPAKILIQNVGIDQLNIGNQGQLSRPNDVMRQVSEAVTEETLPSLLGKEIGNTGKSFNEALSTPTALSNELFNELSIVDLPGYKDTDGIKGISAGDFADEKNYEILVSVFDPTNKNYNYQVTKDAFVQETSATIITDNQNAYNDWEKKQKKTTSTTSGETSNNYMINKQSVPKSAVDGTVKLLNSNPTNTEVQTSWNGITWRVKDSKYQFMSKNGDFVDTTYDELVRQGFKFGDNVGLTSKDSSLPDMPMTDSGVTLEDIRKANPEYFK